jgi:hypothetical protein
VVPAVSSSGPGPSLCLASWVQGLLLFILSSSLPRSADASAHSLSSQSHGLHRVPVSLGARGFLGTGRRLDTDGFSSECIVSTPVSRIPRDS